MEEDKDKKSSAMSRIVMSAKWGETDRASNNKANP